MCLFLLNCLRSSRQIKQIFIKAKESPIPAPSPRDEHAKSTKFVTAQNSLRTSRHNSKIAF